MTHSSWHSRGFWVPIITVLTQGPRLEEQPPAGAGLTESGKNLTLEAFAEK